MQAQLNDCYLLYFRCTWQLLFPSCTEHDLIHNVILTLCGNHCSPASLRVTQYRPAHAELIRQTHNQTTKKVWLLQNNSSELSTMLHFFFFNGLQITHNTQWGAVLIGPTWEHAEETKTTARGMTRCLQEHKQQNEQTKDRQSYIDS